MPQYPNDQGNPAGAIPVYIAPPPGATSRNFAANNAGVALKTGPGVVTGIMVNTAGVTSKIALYDGNSTGDPVLGTFSTTAQGLISMPPGGLPFTDGLFAVLTGGTPADVTVAFA